MSTLCVAHLVRKENGLAPFKSFIDSYRECKPLVRHDLVLIFKGFGKYVEESEFLALSEEIDHRKFFISDTGFDISAYFAVAEEYEHEHFCFLNSFSVLQDQEWLDKLHTHGSRSGVGAVGASGSWESIYSTTIGWRIPGVERNLRPQTIKAYMARRFVGLSRYRRDFPHFPNAHLRTNAFLLRREVMLTLERGQLLSKYDTLRFESGKRGMTRQIRDKNLQVLVVGRDGEAYEPERWPESHTFRSGNQSNLLVSDSRTLDYTNAGLEKRQLMEETAWGRRIGALE